MASGYRMGVRGVEVDEISKVGEDKCWPAGS